jgi:DNA invertase Pin-like site-specific DNA recombinase
MKDTIGYLRVSTREQGRSGLGLAAQRNDIEAFGAREGFRVKSFEVAICNIKSWSRPASQVPAIRVHCGATVVATIPNRRRAV